MIAIIDGAEMVWPRPIGRGTSSYAASASSGRTNNSRGTARNASRTRESWMYREPTSRSTIRRRSAAKSVFRPIGGPPPGRGIKCRLRGDQKRDQDRRQDEPRGGDRESPLPRVFPPHPDAVPGGDPHHDYAARRPQEPPRPPPAPNRGQGQ